MMELAEIGKNIREQDNRCTDAPMFIVQKKVMDVTAHGYHDTHGWFNSDGEYEEATELQAERLDALEEGGREWKGWEKICLKERWEFVTACFTEQGCKDYLARDGHNLPETRIYAAGSYRNAEFRAVRDYLAGLPV